MHVRVCLLNRFRMKAVTVAGFVLVGTLLVYVSLVAASSIQLQKSCNSSDSVTGQLCKEQLVHKDEQNLKDPVWKDCGK